MIEDRRVLAVPALLALAGVVATAVVCARAAGVPLGALGAYFDGHLYLEIARSFPLPFGPGSVDYTGQAPGYPLLAWLLRVLLPNALVSWGGVMLLASWLPAAAATAAFYAVCRALDAPALWPTVFFAAGSPRIFTMAASSHPEPLALLFVLLALLAFSRDRIGPSVTFIVLAGFTRFPAFTLLAPLGIALLVRRRPRVRELVYFALAPLLFGLYHLYLTRRVPGFESVAESHRVFWQTGFTVPFHELWRAFDATLWSKTHPTFALTYATVAFYLATIGLGAVRSVRTRDPLLIALTGQVAIIVGIHVSLAGVLGAWDFLRLTALAWPAALLLWACTLRRELPRGIVAACAAALFAASLFYGRAQVTEAVQWQKLSHGWFLPQTIAELDSDEPRWSDFHRKGSERQ